MSIQWHYCRDTVITVSYPLAISCHTVTRFLISLEAAQARHHLITYSALEWSPTDAGFADLCTGRAFWIVYFPSTNATWTTWKKLGSSDQTNYVIRRQSKPPFSCVMAAMNKSYSGLPVSARLSAQQSCHSNKHWSQARISGTIHRLPVPVRSWKIMVISDGERATLLPVLYFSVRKVNTQPI